MKRKKIFILILIILIILIIGLVCFKVFHKSENSCNNFEKFSQTRQSRNSKSKNWTTPQTSNVYTIKSLNAGTYVVQARAYNGTYGSTGFKEELGTKVSSTSEVKSALIENVELHATYYLEETYVEANSFVAKGEKILKYTNGTYLKAPYDCYIVELNIPNEEGKCLNSHSNPSRFRSANRNP